MSIVTGSKSRRQSSNFPRHDIIPNDSERRAAMEQPIIWITGPVAEVALAPLRQIAEVRLRAAAERASPEEMAEGARGVAGLVPVNGAVGDAVVLAAAG